METADQEARRYFEICRKTPSYFAEIGQTWKKLGFHYYARKKYDKAFECIIKAVRICPRNTQFYQDLKKATSKAHKHNPNGNYFNQAEECMEKLATDLQKRNAIKESTCAFACYKKLKRISKKRNHLKPENDDKNHTPTSLENLKT